MNPSPLFVTQCRHCGKKFEAASLSVPILNKPTDQRVAERVGKFAEHIQKAHPEFMPPAILAMQHMFGVEIMKNFAVEDPDMVAAIENVRRALHNNTRKYLVSDSAIQQAVAQLELSEPDSKKVLTAMKELRDVLMESLPATHPLHVVTPNGHPV
jgi:hypothetical protein